MRNIVGESLDLVLRKNLGVKVSFNGSIESVLKVVVDYSEYSIYFMNFESVVIIKESVIN